MDHSGSNEAVEVSAGRWQIDADAAAILRAAASRTPVTDMSPEEARAQSRAAREAMARPLEPVAEVRDLAAHVGDRSVPLRLFRPVTAPGAGAGDAALVYFHGGGWMVGDLDGTEPVCRALANRIGAVVLSVDYRLAPEWRYPAAADDARDAVAWVLERASTLGIDPARVAVGGDSSGGNVALAACLALRERGGPVPVAQLLVYPVTHCALDAEGFASDLDSAVLSASTMAWYCRQYLAADRDPAAAALRAAEAAASPLLAPSLVGLPPTVVVSAALDVLRPQIDAFAVRLAEAGVEVIRQHYDGVFHGFFTMAPAVAKAGIAVDAAARALRPILGISPVS